MRMKWNELQTIKALIVYKKVKEEISKDKVFQKNKLSSFIMKLGNFISLDPGTGKGLKSASKRDKEIWGKYKNIPIKKLEDIVKKG